jgi:hypothetical protein
MMPTPIMMSSPTMTFERCCRRAAMFVQYIGMQLSTRSSVLIVAAVR